MTTAKRTLEEPTRYSNMGFSVGRRSSNQVFNPVGFFFVTYDAAPINDVGAFNVGVGNYICPKAGRMLVGANLAIKNSSGANNSFVAVRIRGLPSSMKNYFSYIGQKAIAPGTIEFFSGSVFMDVEVGTEIALEVYAGDTQLTIPVTTYGEDIAAFYGFYMT